MVATLPQVSGFVLDKTKRPSRALLDRYEQSRALGGNSNPNDQKAPCRIDQI